MQAVQIPPAAAVGNEVQQAVRRPFRLANRLARAAGDQAWRPQAAVRVHVGQPQFRALPRQARVVPADPGQLAAIRRQTRRRIKVVAARQHRFTPVEADGGQAVFRMRVPFCRMLLAHGDQAGTGRIDDEVRVARVATRGQRFRRGVAGHAVQAIVGEMRKIHGIAGHGIRAAAVFMHAGAHIEGRRREFIDPRAALAQQGVAARLAGAPGQPEHVGAIRPAQGQLRQRRGASGDDGRADRRWPDAIRGAGCGRGHAGSVSWWKGGGASRRRQAARRRASS